MRHNVAKHSLNFNMIESLPFLIEALFQRRIYFAKEKNSILCSILLTYDCCVRHKIRICQATPLLCNIKYPRENTDIRNNIESAKVVALYNDELDSWK